MRVLSRIRLIRDDIMQPATRQGMESLAQGLIPPGQASSFNQALMELGALICTPTSPKCLICPVAPYCQARAEGVQHELPVKAKAKAPRPVERVAAVIAHQGKVMIVRRPTDGLLGGLWEFPGDDKGEGATWERAVHTLLQERYGLQLEVEAQLVSVKHIFSHLVWDLRAYTARLADTCEPPPESDTLRWVAPTDLAQFALPVAYQKVAAALLACSSGSGAIQ